MDAVTIIFAAALVGSPMWVARVAAMQFCRRLEFELTIRWWVSKSLSHRGGRA